MLGHVDTHSPCPVITFWGTMHFVQFDDSFSHSAHGETHKTQAEIYPYMYSVSVGKQVSDLLQIPTFVS